MAAQPMSQRPQVGTFTTVEVVAQLRESADRFANLVPRITDEAAVSPHLPDWPVSEIVRHVTILPDYYQEIAAGNAELIDEATDMASKNTQNIARIEGLSLSECAEHMIHGIDAFCRVVEADDGQSLVDFHAGSTGTLTQIAAIAVGEYEVHGLDLAAALGVPWQIERNGAAMCILGALPVAGTQWLDAEAVAGHSGSYRIKLRGGSGAVHVSFSDGAARICGSPDTAASEPASTLISADPVAFLKVFYRRQSQWAAIARAQMLSYGTKPLRALTLKDKFLPI
ncbi:MAG: maleylpyruvate isomerase N-terminal domain-containing protein [Acidimicrobiia bacterium]|nr:maleylpyruvate isomerase N-terminal domain-containing protein [Acidimicrobiia bacterium]